VPLAFPGNGAVNRIVGPIRPVMRDGAAYIAIDLAETPVQFAYERTGLQALYNTVVPFDSRKLVAYGRDISALSADDVRRLQRPAKLTRFPDDLLFARGLEFSGIYEDGWLSPQSEFVLQGGPQAWARVRGFVPELPGAPLGRGRLRMTLPGGVVEVPAPVGSFDWLVPVGSTDGSARLAFTFTAHTALPNGDDRPVGGKLEWLEIFPSLPTYTFNFGQTTSSRLAANGVDQDGWFARTATIQLPAFPVEHDIVLELEPSSSADVKPTTLRASWGAGAAQEFVLTPNLRGTFRLRLPASAEGRTLTLEATDDFPLAAPDPRRRAGRLVLMELQPTQRP
jgi:hypothetical protein